jgi:hypothetical protein
VTPNRGPVHRCAVRGCVFIGHWAEGGLCPSHRDGYHEPARPPSLAESWAVDGIEPLDDGGR